MLRRIFDPEVLIPILMQVNDGIIYSESLFITKRKTYPCSMKPFSQAMKDHGKSWEIVFVDDGSKDASLEGARRPGKD